MDSEKHDLNKGETAKEIQFYISTLKEDARLINRDIRSHWGIENKAQWILDVAFWEDDIRVSDGNTAQTFSVIR